MRLSLWIIHFFGLIIATSTASATSRIGPVLRNAGVALVAKESEPGVLDGSFAKQYKKEIRPLLVRALNISHKELLFVLLRVVLQASMTVRNPNDPLLSGIMSVLKFFVDILFQFFSLHHYKNLINNEFGSPRVPETRAIAWKDRIAGFVAIRGLQRLAFRSAFQIVLMPLYAILPLLSRTMAAHAIPVIGTLEEQFLEFDINSAVVGTFCASLLGMALFKLLWGFAIKLTIADKVYLWNIGGGAGDSSRNSIGGGTGTGKGDKERINVVQAVRASFRLVDELDASFLISRLSALYIAPRILLAFSAPGCADFLFAYQDVVFMLASHLVFLDRFLGAGARGKR